MKLVEDITIQTPHLSSLYSCVTFYRKLVETTTLENWKQQQAWLEDRLFGRSINVTDARQLLAAAYLFLKYRCSGGFVLYPLLGKEVIHHIEQLNWLRHYPFNVGERLPIICWVVPELRSRAAKTIPDFERRYPLLHHYGFLTETTLHRLFKQTFDRKASIGSCFPEGQVIGFPPPLRTSDDVEKHRLLTGFFPELYGKFFIRDCQRSCTPDIIPSWELDAEGRFWERGELRQALGYPRVNPLIWFGGRSDVKPLVCYKKTKYMTPASSGLTYLVKAIPRSQRQPVNDEGFPWAPAVTPVRGTEIQFEGRSVVLQQLADLAYRILYTGVGRDDLLAEALASNLLHEDALTE